MSKQIKAKRMKKLKAVALRDSKDKSVLVSVNLVKMHPLYRKRYTVKRKYLVHTNGEVKSGDDLIIQECRPISKRKAWKQIEIKEGK